MSTDRRDTVRVGRPRDDAIDAAVLDEATVALQEVGYARLSMADVARRARTSKPALYRRWPTKQRLVLAALHRRISEVEPPDTSCTLCDLAECLVLFGAAYSAMPPGILAPLLADGADDPELRADVMTQLVEPPRAAVRATLGRAQGRGDLRPDLDLDQAVDLLASFVHHRALFGQAGAAPAEIESLVETLLQGIAVDYDALMARTRVHEIVAAPHDLHTG